MTPPIPNDRRFGPKPVHKSRLTFIRRVYDKTRRSRGEYLCSCGKTTQADIWKVKTGHTKSCGCLHDVAAVTHGRTGTPEYIAWESMNRRCYDDADDGYQQYGGRGIKVCDEWRFSFQSFFDFMGRKPSHRHSIDRINNDLGYHPDNCRWATPREQARNRRTNRHFTINGETKLLPEWADTTGISLTVLRSRVKRHWPLNRLFDPVQARSK